MSPGRAAAKVVDIEIALLLEAVYLRYGYDFRDYSRASVKRRLDRALETLGCRTISEIQDRILHDQAAFGELLQYLTIPVSEMFRDPSYFRAIREKVVPILRTYPSLKLWVAGCSTGEEVYSFAILLKEEGLLEKTIIYATDINPVSLKRAREGVYGLEQMAKFTTNYQQAGGKKEFSDYYVAGQESALMDRALRKNVVFSDHSLATDSVFSEVQLVSCRNVLIYFNPGLQDRAIGLFKDSLCYKGFLGLGSKEAIRSSAHAADFDAFVASEKIFQKKSGGRAG